MKETKINLPFPLPTWNRILAMHFFQRKQLRDLIHQAVLIATTHKNFDIWDKEKYMKLIRPRPKKKK